MKKLPPRRSIIAFVAALVAGLVIGLGVGQIQVNKEQKVCRDNVKEANKKAAYFQQKMEEEKSVAMVSLEQKERQCRGDVDKLQASLQKEKRVLGAQLTKLQEQAQSLEMKLKQTDEAFAKTKGELQATERTNKDLNLELKKTKTEKQSLTTELKRTTRDLGQCSSNNAALCTIAGELVKKYKNKGIGDALLEKEPLTQFKKVELEQLTQKYRDEIEQLQIEKKVVEGKHVAE